MARTKRKKLDEREVQGVRQLEKLLPLVERLQGVGCERDKAGTRRLFMHQYCLLVLLYFFNPIRTSLRGIQQASELKKVQRRLGCPRASLGSLSEATQVFRSAALAEIVNELASQLGKLPQITPAAWQTQRHPHGWRLHTPFEVLRNTAVRVALTDGRNRGGSNEKSVLRTMLEPDRCYILDRGYEQFALFNAIVAVKSSYVCRLRGDHHLTPTQVLPLSDAAQQAGVVEDALGALGSPQSQRIEHPDHPVRVVRLPISRHPKRGDAAIENITLATNLVDVPADLLALVYQHRWMVELFFRFFQHVLGCRHLLSHDPVGIEIQTYCAIIVCLLISLWTGRKPTLRTFEMIQFYFVGWADEEELLAHLEKLKRYDA